MSGARLDLGIAGVFCAAVGLYDILYVAFAFTGGPVIGPRNLVMFPDFLVFHAAVGAWRDGRQAVIYDLDAFTHLQTALYAARLPGALLYRPFLYPPNWLLMLLPFGVLAVGTAYGAFMAATASIATLLEGRRDWTGWLAILVSPAAAWVTISGQNTFLSLGLFYGGLHLLPRAPVAAGILLGLLAYKPQIWVLVPLALLAARQWTALAAALGTVAAVSLASLAVFGLDFWRAFFAAAREAGAPAATERMFESVHTQMTTILAAARMAGAPPDLAALLQIAGAALGVLAVWFAFRRPGPVPGPVPGPGRDPARTAVLAAATFLISPYTLNYDLLLLMPAIVSVFRLGAARSFYPGERTLYPLLWLSPTLGWAFNQLGLPVVPLLVLLFGGAAWKRLGERATTA